MIAVDSSVVIAACASWHEAHRTAQRALDEEAPRLVGHCAFEAYSVLTRLPGGQRIPPALVVEFLRGAFPDEPLALPTAQLMGSVGELQERGVSGGAVYDGLIAMSARAHGAKLLSLDQRASETYRRCDVEFRLL